MDRRLCDLNIKRIVGAVREPPYAHTDFHRNGRGKPRPYGRFNVGTRLASSAGRLFMIVSLLVFISTSLYAQNDDNVTNAAITYGETVQDTITEQSFYDLWAFYGDQGDHIRVEMTASGGLVPLIGLLDASRTLVARSDALSDNTFQDAVADSTITLDLMLPTEGEYVINATRAGTADGTTTGEYTLRLTLMNEPSDETLACGESAPVVSLEWMPDRGMESGYRVTVFGEDGFEPVIGMAAPESNRTACIEADADSVARLEMQNVENWGIIQLTLSSPTSGRFVMVIEGFTLDPSGDQDSLTVIPTGEVTVYMVRADATRVDPIITARVDGIDTVCDDAGRRGCDAVEPSIDTVEIKLEEDQVIRGTRFDAGVQVEGQTTIRLASRASAARGVYYIIAVGEK